MGKTGEALVNTPMFCPPFFGGFMQKNYPICTYDPFVIKAWYRNLKNSCQCPACNILQPTATFIEFHHLERSTKCDTLSNMVFFQAPLSLIFAETLKVMPLCHDHHVRYHKLERYGHTDLINNLYDFKNDNYYSREIDSFHYTAWETAPDELKTAYIDYMESGIEICNRPTKQPVTPKLSYREV